MDPKKILQDEIEAKIGDVITFTIEGNALSQQVVIVDAVPSKFECTDPNELRLYLRNTTTKKLLVLPSGKVFPSVKKHIEKAKSDAKKKAREEEVFRIDLEQFGFNDIAPLAPLTSK